MITMLKLQQGRCLAILQSCSLRHFLVLLVLAQLSVPSPPSHIFLLKQARTGGLFLSYAYSALIFASFPPFFSSSYALFCLFQFIELSRPEITSEMLTRPNQASLHVSPVVFIRTEQEQLRVKAVKQQIAQV